MQRYHHPIEAARALDVVYKKLIRGDKVKQADILKANVVDEKKIFASYLSGKRV
jgi:hypothetical protein